MDTPPHLWSGWEIPDTGSGSLPVAERTLHLREGGTEARREKECAQSRTSHGTRWDSACHGDGCQLPRPHPPPLTEAPSEHRPGECSLHLQPRLSVLAGSAALRATSVPHTSAQPGPGGRKGDRGTAAMRSQQSDEWTSVISASSRNRDKNQNLSQLQKNTESTLN